MRHRLPNVAAQPSRVHRRPFAQALVQTQKNLLAHVIRRGCPAIPEPELADGVTDQLVVGLRKDGFRAGEILLIAEKNGRLTGGLKRVAWVRPILPFAGTLLTGCPATRKASQ